MCVSIDLLKCVNRMLLFVLQGQGMVAMYDSKSILEIVKLFSQLTYHLVLTFVNQIIAVKYNILDTEECIP